MILQIVQIAAIVVFVLSGLLLGLLVLIQDEQGDSIGGLFGGGSNSAFGARSGNILTRTTTVLGVIFFGLAIFLAVWFRSPGGDILPEAQPSSESPADWLNSPLEEVSPLDDILTPSPEVLTPLESPEPEAIP